jgi:hypothetical protein
LKWLVPFLTVPVLFIASTLVESWLQESGVTPYIPVGKRSVLSIWRIAIITCAVAAPLASIYLGELWKKWKHTGESFTGYFFRAVFSVLLLVTAAMTLNGLGVLVPLGIPSSLILQMILTRCIFAALWIVAAATLCSSITSGTGGGALAFGLFSMALLPGLSGSAVSWWVIAPLGTMVSATDSAATGWNVSLAATAHSLLYFAAGYFLLRKTIR